MRAWVLEKAIGINGLTLIDNYKIGEVQDDEVKIAIKACGINNRDLFIAKGIYYRNIIPPCILGSDIAGEVIKKGKNVSDLVEGDRVVISPVMGCGICEACIDKKENDCTKYDSLMGGLGSFCIVKANSCIKISDFFHYREAAALPIAYLTAWNMLFKKAKVKGNEYILFWGASSGVGTAGLILFNYPEKSILIVGSKEKEKLLREQGFVHFINYKDENIIEKVLTLTNGKGVDVIFDPVGKAAWKDNLLLLKNNGIHVNCARNTGETVKIDLAHLFSKQITIHGAKTGTKEDLIEITKHLEKIKRKPIIDCCFEFEQVVDALNYFEQSRKIGKVVIEYVSSE